jgi:hypothetical protein
MLSALTERRYKTFAEISHRIEEKTPTSVRRCLAMQEFGDAFFEPVQVERLGEEILGVHRGRATRHVAGERAHEDDGDLFRVRLALEDFADRQAVQIRQQNVQEDQVRLELPGLAKRVDTVIRRDDFAMQAREAKFHQFNEVAFIIHDQYAGHHAENIVFAAKTATAGLLNQSDVPVTVILGCDQGAFFLRRGFEKEYYFRVAVSARKP